MMSGPVGDGEVDLSIGEPDQPLPGVLVETAVRSLRDGHTGYTPKLGLPTLRELVADDLDGHRPPADDVIITIGGTGAVAVALTAVGGPIIVPDPAWPNYRVLAGQLGIKVLDYRQGRSGDDFFDLEGISDKLRKGAKLIVVNSPSNPTGATASPDALRALVELVRRHDAYILSDEAYESIVFAGGRAPTPFSVGGADITFAARTFSKTYSMTGLRAGALISPPSFRAAVAAVHGTTAGCAPITAQLTAIEALRSLPYRGGEMSEIYGHRFAEARRILGPWAPADSAGGFYLWLDARSTGRGSADLCALLRKRGVVASSGLVYTEEEGFIRLALTAPDDQLTGALTAVREELDHLSR
jgi:aspartate/methionine/tyrosine aminotransferase